MSAEITVEAGGLVLRGIAVPYGEETVVVSPSPRGGRVVHRERFDERSIPDVGALYGRPILIGHDDTRPVGRIRMSRSTAPGLEIEADLVGSDEEVEGIRRRLGVRLQSGLSVGFFPDREADEWRQPAAPGELPLVTRRGVEIRETSLVVWPAYVGASVTGVHLRTVVGEQREVERVLRHNESERALDAAKRAVDASRQFLARRR